MSAISASDQTVCKLSQWDALMLESLKGWGWPAEELIRRVIAGELPEDTSKFSFDYSRMTELAASDPALFSEAVLSGYRIKYNTLRGIASWILLALGQEARLDTEPGRESVTAELTVEEHGRLTAVLSVGWILSEIDASGSGEKTTYRIEPQVRGVAG